MIISHLFTSMPYDAAFCSEDSGAVRYGSILVLKAVWWNKANYCPSSKLELTFTAARQWYLSLLYFFFVLTEPADLLLPSSVGVVMVTHRRLKKRSDRFGLIWAQHPTSDTTRKQKTHLVIYSSMEMPPHLPLEHGEMNVNEEAGSDIFSKGDWNENFKESLGDVVDADYLSFTIFSQSSIFKSISAFPTTLWL